jgi:hypothetical protein
MADENDDIKGPKTKPLRKTSAVPLRKETVRVTLKATPAGASGAPRPPAPAPPKPPSVATTPLETSPIDQPSPKDGFLGGGPSLPDVTSAVPLRQETMRVTLKADNTGARMAPAPSMSQPSPMVPAPTIPIGMGYPSGPAAPSTPAPTIPLGSYPGIPQLAQPAPTVALGGGFGNATVPLINQPLGHGSSQPLPQATVALQQTQQLTSAFGTNQGVSQFQPTLQVEWEKDIERSQGIKLWLSVAAFLVALAALGTQLFHAQHWLEEHKGGDWANLAEPEVKLKQKDSAAEYKTFKK